MSSESNFIEYLNTLPETPETIQMKKYFENQIKFKNQTLHYKDKFNVIMSFIKFIKTICKQSRVKIYGSFVRNILEKIFVSTANIGYADPINHDIDIVLYHDKYIFETDKQNFSDFISLMQIVSNTEKYDFNFYGFKIIDVIEKTLRPNDVRDESGFGKKFMIDIPHYVIILQKDNHKIKIDMLGYKTENRDFDTWQNEFNINSLSMSEYGIFCKDSDDIKSSSYNFYETINSIITKSAVCNLPFETLLSGFTHKYRNEKCNIVNQIIWFFSNRIKILGLGYTDIKSDKKIFDFEIERTEPCLLSGNEAPYIKIKLTCGHHLSIMALAGLVNIQASEWSDAIKCPLCRHDLNFALIEAKPTNIQIPSQPEKEMVTLDDYETTQKLFSAENTDYITHILNRKTISDIQSNFDARPTMNTAWETVDNIPVQPRQNNDVILPTPITRRAHPLVGRRIREDYPI